jgi:phosphoribosylamine-glycine ligase
VEDFPKSQGKKIYCAPGNAGIAQLAECLSISAEDVKALTGWAEKERIDLTVVGPEAPLTLGIVEAFREKGLRTAIQLSQDKYCSVGATIGKTAKISHSYSVQ